jgi:hypothetical protein
MKTLFKEDKEMLRKPVRLHLVLSLVMAIAITMAMAMAMQSLWLPVVSYAADGNTGTIEQLQTRISSSGTGDVILSADIGNVTTQLTIGRSLTLDLNGQSLTIILPAAVGNNGNCIKINKDVTLTIMDSAGGGSLYATNNASGTGVSTGSGAAINTTDGALAIDRKSVV